ncbi:glycosyltransferase family 2 protein [Salininema proteolyticum]|uniref:Glycosyltransferase family 2 protein n=1 Tax=Salininema proteolyticum TaxID=1607685 RepID=A0ABV8TWZ0_9ACTN
MTAVDFPSASDRTPLIGDAPRLTTEISRIWSEFGREAVYKTGIRTRSHQLTDCLEDLAAEFDEGGTRHGIPRQSGGGGRASAEVRLVLGCLYARRGLFEEARSAFNRAASAVDIREWSVDEHFYYGTSALQTSGSLPDGLLDAMRQGDFRREALATDAVHPDFGGEPGPWLARFEEFCGWTGLELREGDDAPAIDRLTFAPAPERRHPSLISIIMTTYNPTEELHTAIDSIRRQTWTNWELIVVDDHSDPSCHELLRSIAADDPRVRLHLLPENGGTYRARNVGLSLAQGEFTTGFDSDDVASNRWLEEQVEPLLHDESLVMTSSSCYRVTEDLRATGTGRPVRGPRSTSVLFRTEEVRQRLGFFDTVRKGADTEIHERIRAAFGRGSTKFLKNSIHTLVRLQSGTLTSQEIYGGWKHAARTAYQSSHHQWRKRIRKGEASPFLPAHQTERAFYAPPHHFGEKFEGSEFDLLVVADLRTDTPELRRALDALREAEDGEAVGLVHMESLLRPTKDDGEFCPEAVDFLHSSGVPFVAATTAARTGRLLAAQPDLVDGRHDEFSIEYAEFALLESPPTRSAGRDGGESTEAEPRTKTDGTPAPSENPASKSNRNETGTTARRPGLRKMALLALCILGAGLIAAVGLAVAGYAAVAIGLFAFIAVQPLAVGVLLLGDRGHPLLLKATSKIKNALPSTGQGPAS